MSYTPPNPNGQATSANSAPVVIASDQSAVPVSSATLATAAAQTTGNTSLATVATNTGNIPAKGANTKANSMPVTMASDQTAIPVSLATAPTTPVTGTFWQATQPISAASLPLPTGAALDTTLTGGTQQSKITDGTNVASVLKSDGTAAGQNAVMVSNAYQTASFSVTAVQAGTAYDLGDYRWVSVHVLTQYTGTTPTIAWQTSNDGTNWVGMVLMSAVSTVSASSASTTTTGIIYSGGVPGRYFRLNFTGAYTSGTATGQIMFSTLPTAHTVMGTATTLNAGSNIAGKVGIDQTTVGTTNAVSLAQLGTGTIATGNGTSSAGTLRVAIASDQTSNTNPLLVAQQVSGSAAITSVAGAAVSTTVLAANAARKGAYFYNESTAILYLAFAATASTTAYTVQLAAGGYYEMPEKPLYTGLITGIWASANGNVRVTELS